MIILGGVSSAFKSDLVMPFAIFDENAPTQQQKQNGNIEDKENM